MEFLLQEAFLYASFIIKQRAGNTGPGTDFDLSSSPFKVEVPRDQVGRFIKNLGCVFEKQDMIDAWRYNKDNNPLLANDAGAEATTDMIDLLSNGFKFRIATDPNVAETYIYLAFAEAPFVNSNGVPCNAR